MDVQMPEMDGLEATVEIRERERRRGGHAPIVALTAHAMKGDRERCVAAGMDGYVSKPLRSEELLAAIERAVGMGAPATPLPRDPAEPGAFDSSVLLESACGDPTLLAKIIELYFADAPERVEEIRSGLAASERRRVARAAHRLRGSLGMLGASLAAAAAGQLEDLAPAAPLEALLETFAELEREMDRLEPELQRLAGGREAA
jgi:HPt (histidine-containing phosphotransfer) domain-containing protein